ncbi:hypothetical protein SK128_007078 [Halocaridina rubra]|uniref:Uncharacterized protein n=1 Tax=Halocaridina rubra TaxID=373956 RepID=A0AAN8XGC8_HALRR
MACGTLQWWTLSEGKILRLAAWCLGVYLTLVVVIDSSYGEEVFLDTGSSHSLKLHSYLKDPLANLIKDIRVERLPERVFVKRQVAVSGSATPPSPKMAVSSEASQGKVETSMQDKNKPPLAGLNQAQKSLVQNETAKVAATEGAKTADSSVAMNGDDEEMGLGPKGLSPDALFRLFYVFVGVGVIILIYILIKLLRLRRRRALRKYRVLAHTDDQEMFPLAADDGEDEEIFNAADHQTQK